MGHSPMLVSVVVSGLLPCDVSGMSCRGMLGNATLNRMLANPPGDSLLLDD